MTKSSWGGEAGVDDSWKIREVIAMKKEIGSLEELCSSWREKGEDGISSIPDWGGVNVLQRVPWITKKVKWSDGEDDSDMETYSLQLREWGEEIGQEIREGNSNRKERIPLKTDFNALVITESVGMEIS